MPRSVPLSSQYTASYTAGWCTGAQLSPHEGPTQPYWAFSRIQQQCNYPSPHPGYPKTKRKKERSKDSEAIDVINVPPSESVPAPALQTCIQNFALRRIIRCCTCCCLVHVASISLLQAAVDAQAAEEEAKRSNQLAAMLKKKYVLVICRDAGTCPECCHHLRGGV